ncbi:transient receptor potential cation channel subfamily M member 7-like [Hydractinia symbiolongicarpus]|uniref:transient receptor potential cation channel subfamily M member 7-like n=1 Tax=Hydractinia symbiolongicarpus TaxID=13093 RepID=UPI00254FE5CB|nr:transient receptor potential cation channel subfamily M member 7-like [Hydractinia symbiolongicarpus]
MGVTEFSSLKAEDSVELQEIDGKPKYKQLNENGNQMKSATLSSTSSKRKGTEWVLKTFRKKYCVKYVPSSKNRNICCCGRERESHGEAITEDEIAQNQSIVWDVQSHLREEGTNAYGDIEFHGSGKKTRAKFLRISADTSPKEVLWLLIKEWHLEFPRLLISVTGGAKSFKLNPKLKALFTAGLSKVVQSTGAWVTTGGTNTGVMKHVGEALQGSSTFGINNNAEITRNVNCIGIATWGIVNDRKRLTNTKGKTVDYHMTSSFEMTGACLDNNHTHFLLVDSGLINRYGGEIAFRGALEKCIRKMEIDKNRAHFGVPGVQLVLEGGPNTVLTVYEAITQEPPMPVVVIKGSGRAADLLAFAQGLAQGSGPLFEMADVVEHGQLISMIEQFFPELDSTGTKAVYLNILKCVEKKEFITVFQMDEGREIDEAILTAFLKGKNIRSCDQLNLAMLWNRADIARSQIFVEGVKWTEAELNDAMKCALWRNKPEFVELLLEHGVSMARFLTIERLEDLYNSRATKSSNIVRTLLGDEKCNKGIIKLSDVSWVLKKLLGTEIRNEKYVEKISHINKAILPRNIKEEQRSFKHSFSELFLWAILCNMPEMALCLWAHGEEALAKALIAKILYQNMAQQLERRHMQEVIIEIFNKNDEKFGVLSTQLLNECFESNELLTGQLVTYNLENWGLQTCLSLAVASNHQDFVAHTCCQDLISSKWTGALQFSGAQAYQVLLGLIVPPCILLLKFRSRKELSKLIMTEEEHRAVEEEEQELERQEQLENMRKNTKEKQNQHRPSRSVAYEDSTELSLSNASYSISYKGSTLSNEMYVELSKQLPWYKKLVAFYRAPVTKFWGNVAAYLLFLILFAFVISTELGEDPFNTEWVLVVMVITLCTEEIRQVLQSDAYTFIHKLRDWASSYWNICDAIAIALFFLGFGLRMNADTRTAGHVVYAVDIILWIIRLLDIFSVNKYLGPYVVMIGRMTLDMAYFMFILLVFLTAYGVSRYAILNTSTKRTWGTIGEMVFAPYFQIYGELFLEYPQQNKQETIFSTVKENTIIEVVVALIMAAYLLVANILLLNLLIAKFNNTYTTVQANSNVIWKFQRYHLIQEYSIRPWLLPPLSIFIHIFQFFQSLYRSCKKRAKNRHTDRKLKKFLHDGELHDLMLFEERCLASYLRKRDTILLATQEEKLKMISERVDNIAGVFTEYSREVQHQNKKLVASRTKLEERVTSIENMMRTVMLNVSHVQAALKNNNIIPDTTYERRKHAFKDTHYLNRSISEYPNLSDKISLGAVPASPISLPATAYQFPKRRPERTSMVRRAAYNFRKGSLETQNILNKSNVDGASEETTGRPRRLTTGEDSIDETQTENMYTTRRNTFPSRHNPRLSTVLSSENGDSEGESPFEESFARAHNQSKQSESSTTNKDIRSDSARSNSSYTQSDVSNSSYTRSDGSPRLSDGFNSNVEDLDVVDQGSCEKVVNVLSRCTMYPLSNVKRFLLPDHLVEWDVPVDEYKPSEYTSYTISAQPEWADKEIVEGDESTMRFNAIDGEINRVSFTGTYPVINGLPRNPFGRTGLKGRGLLARYGPNHFAEPIITRWSRNYFEMSGKYSDTLEVLVSMKKNSDTHVLPSGSFDQRDEIPQSLRHIFSEKTLENLGLNATQRRVYVDDANKIFQNGELIFQGYVDDQRNTDNAWIEATVYNYHDDSGTIFSKFLLGNESERLNIQWTEVCADINLPEYQANWLQQVALNKCAYFG